FLVLIGLASTCFGLIAAPDFGWTDPSVLAPLAGGLVLLGVFAWVERRQAAPMLPFDLFRSRTFSLVNLLTLLLYAALAVAFFFLSTTPAPFRFLLSRAVCAGAISLPSPYNS